MKVLVVSSQYHPYVKGGGEYSVKGLVDSLAKLPDVEVEVLTAFRSNTTDTVDGVQVHRIKSPNIYWSFDSQSQSRWHRLAWHLLESCNPKTKAIANLIATELKPDVVHFRNIENFSPSIFYYLHQLRIPTLLTLNSYSLLEPKATCYAESRVQKLALLLWRILFLPKRFMSNYATGVAGVSEYTLNKHLSFGYFKKSKKFVIRTKLPLKDERRNNVLNKSPRSNVVFGYLGNFLPTKGVLQLIQAFKRVESTTVYLQLAGDYQNDYGAICKNAAAGDERISFLGKVNSDQFLSDIDVSIIPSIWEEPYPRVLIESHSHLRPVIASTFGGTAEGIHQQKDGWIFADFAECTKVIQQIANHPEVIDEFRKNIQEKLADVTSDESADYLVAYRECLT